MFPLSDHLPRRTTPIVNYIPIDPRIYILNYQWNNEASLLMRSRTSKECKNFDPLPSAFIGRRRV